MLKVNPEDRPNINEVIERLKEIAEAQGINIKQPLSFRRMAYATPPGELYMINKKKLSMNCKFFSDFYTFSKMFRTKFFIVHLIMFLDLS